jgi:DNA repair exonuclease SbcCD ATPase subunit
MQKIILKELTLVNFKGIHGLTLTFKPDATVIGGENGIGKTTVFDAFTWLLFGKDSRGRSDFNIKTLDATGAFIPHIEHSVSALLEVNGKDLRLTRKYQEKWTRPKGDGEQRLYLHMRPSVGSMTYHAPPRKSMTRGCHHSSRKTSSV